MSDSIETTPFPITVVLPNDAPQVIATAMGWTPSANIDYTQYIKNRVAILLGQYYKKGHIDTAVKATQDSTLSAITPSIAAITVS